MKKDRLIQSFALLVSLGAVLGSALLVPTLNKQRLDYELSYDLDFGDNVPPHVAMAVTALGSFRGIAASMLWYRLEMLKRDGEFYEADTTSRMITVLQPRFPQVWTFMAWNMAYNISVETHTPEERWDWVNKGIRLLREEGIPYNPRSVLLYKELGWLFFHKMGQRSDDMHRYYKYRFAAEWDEVLGPMYEGRTNQQIVNEMVPLVTMSERYWTQNQPNLATRLGLRQFIDDGSLSDSEEDVELKKLIYGLEEQTPTRLLDLLPELEEAIKSRQASWPEFDTDGFIELLREQIERQIDGAVQGGERAFIEDFSGGRRITDLTEFEQQFFQFYTPASGEIPDVRPVLAVLAEHGIALDRDGLRAIGRIIGVVERLLMNEALQVELWRMPDPDLKLLQLQRYGLEASDVPAYDAFMQIWHNARPDDETGEVTGEPMTWELMRVVMPYWRSKVITESYKMDPGTMFLLMNAYGPVDWRMPSAHSLYWAHRGIQRAMQLQDKERIDVVNTQRMIIHSMQEAYRFGTLTLNPFAENPADRVNESPNFAFVPSYEKAMIDSEEVYRHLTGAMEGALEHFAAGHQNFLSDVVITAYLYGDERMAQHYLTRLKDEYGEELDTMGRFTLALPDFVYAELQGDLTTRHDSIRRATTVLIQRGFKEGLADGDVDTFAARLQQAQRWHAEYNAEQQGADANAGTRGRLVLPPWNEYVQNVFVQWMLDASQPPTVRWFALQNAPSELVLASWDRIRTPLQQQMPFTVPDPAGWTPDAVRTGGPDTAGTQLRN